MELTKRYEKQLNKVFDNPKKLRKWFNSVYEDMVRECDEKTKKLIGEYLDIYSITVAYTAHYVLGLGAKRLPEFMERVWNNVDCFEKGYLSLDDCINELKDAGMNFDSVLKYSDELKNRISKGEFLNDNK